MLLIFWMNHSEDVSCEKTPMFCIMWHCKLGHTWNRGQSSSRSLNKYLLNKQYPVSATKFTLILLANCIPFMVMLLLFTCEVRLYSLQPHGPQCTRLPCPSLSPRVCSNSCPLSQWCHPTILSSVTAFSSCPQSFPASRSFPMGYLFVSGGQSTGTSASASDLSMNVQGWFLWGLTGLISLQSKRLSRVFSSTTVQKHQFFSAQHSLRWQEYAEEL